MECGLLTECSRSENQQLAVFLSVNNSSTYLGYSNIVLQNDSIDVTLQCVSPFINNAVIESEYSC